MRTWLYVYSLFPFPLSELFVFSVSGTHPTAGVPDMTVISDIDELGIKQNLQVRYSRNQIYVSFITCRVDCSVGLVSWFLLKFGVQSNARFCMLIVS